MPTGRLVRDCGSKPVPRRNLAALGAIPADGVCPRAHKACPQAKNRRPALHDERLIVFAGTDRTDRTDGTDSFVSGIDGKDGIDHDRFHRMRIG